MKKISKFLLILLALSPGFALAGPFDPPSTDISLLVLNQLFGGLMENLGSFAGGQNAFGESIKTFNSIILSLGGILAAYTILAGTLGTAHDGEMLGKKFSSVWIPIRYSLGTALVLPVIPGGYCVMQQIVMWLVMQGVGLADVVWNSYVGAPIGALTSKMSVSNKQNILKFAEQVALAQGCTYAAASVLNNSSGVIDSVLHAAAGGYDYKTLPNSEKTQYWFGDQAASAKLVFGKNNCGEATLPGAVDKDTADYYGTVGGAVNQTTANNSGKLGSVDSAFTPPSTQPIHDAHIKAGQDLVATLDKAASQAATDKTPIPYATVVAAANTYVKAIESKADAYINGAGDPLEKMKEQSARQGWFLAGAWYTRLTMLNAQIQDSVNVSPSAYSKTSLGSVVAWLDSVNPAIRTVQSEILTKKGQEVTSDSDEKDDSKGKSSKDSNESIGAKITAKVASYLTGIDIKELQNNNKPPIIILQEAGSTLIDWWEGLMAGMLAASGIALLTAGAATPIFLTVIGFIAAPVAALVGIGFTLGYMLPNLPFLMWIGVILGWLIMVIEAIIAAPLWAIMHLHPNGDDLTGKGANGYMLVLGLTLRPVLTVFGLIAALAVTDLMGEFVNKVFFSVFQIGNPAGFKALLVTLFAFCIYTMAQFSLFKKTFALMHVIPDQLLRWIGGGGEQLGQYAGSIADGSGRAQGAIAAASSFAGEKAVSSLGNAINQGKQLKDHANNKKLGEGNEKLQLDAKYGEGTADKAKATLDNGAKNGAKGGNWLGNRNSIKQQADRTAYSSGLERSAQAGGQDGVDDYQQGMDDASQNGYANYGGNIESAAQGVAAQVEQKYLGQQVSGFNSDGGSEASDFMAKVAGAPGGKLDTKRAAPALALLNQARENLGSTALADVLTKANAMPDRSKAREFVQKAVAEAKFTKANRKGGITNDMEAKIAGGSEDSPPPASPEPVIDPNNGLPVPAGSMLNVHPATPTISDAMKNATRGNTPTDDNPSAPE